MAHCGGPLAFPAQVLRVAHKHLCGCGRLYLAQGAAMWGCGMVEVFVQMQKQTGCGKFLKNGRNFFFCNFTLSGQGGWFSKKMDCIFILDDPGMA